MGESLSLRVPNNRRSPSPHKQNFWEKTLPKKRVSSYEPFGQHINLSRLFPNVMFTLNLKRVKITELLLLSNFIVVLKLLCFKNARVF